MSQVFSVSNVNGRDRNLIEKVYNRIDDVARRSNWDSYWIEKGLESPTDFTPNRKFIHDGKEWTYGSPHEEATLRTSEINQFIDIALDEVKGELTRNSKLLSSISTDNVRDLIEKFSRMGML